MSIIHPTAEERVDQERRSTSRWALNLLMHPPEGVGPDQIRPHIVATMLDSVMKQARWSGPRAQRDQDDG